MFLIWVVDLSSETLSSAELVRVVGHDIPELPLILEQAIRPTEITG
jgi:hypothetical protein